MFLFLIKIVYWINLIFINILNLFLIAKKWLKLLICSHKQLLDSVGDGTGFRGMLFKSCLPHSLLFFRRVEKSEIFGITHSWRATFYQSSSLWFLWLYNQIFLNDIHLKNISQLSGSFHTLHRYTKNYAGSLSCLCNHQIIWKLHKLYPD